MPGWYGMPDDFFCGFQYRDDSEKFFKVFPKRFGKYGLSLAEEKTRILEFGRFSKQNCEKRHERNPKFPKKPGTFDFLGITFYCSERRESGKFIPKIKSAGKRFRTKVAKMNAWLRDNRFLRLKDIMKHINQVFEGYFQYYAVTCNFKWANMIWVQTIKLLFKWLNRRSQRQSYTWDGFNDMDMLKNYPLQTGK